MRNEQWIIYELVCIWSDWKSLNELNFSEDIYIKFRETEMVEISVTESCVNSQLIAHAQM